jgi:hypothetical protein
MRFEPLFLPGIEFVVQGFDEQGPAFFTISHGMPPY